MYEIPAIPTEYKGVTFRSKLESQWALFFDTKKIKWKYEPRCVDLPSGPYLIDFWLPDLNMVVEIKPSAGADLERARSRCQELADRTTSKVALLCGNPGENTCEYWERRNDINDSPGELQAPVGGVHYECKTWDGFIVWPDVRVNLATNTWNIADRKFFERNKARDWFVRDPFPGEINSFETFGGYVECLLEKLREIASLPNHEKMAMKMRVLVLQIKKGTRQRLPYLWFKGAIKKGLPVMAYTFMNIDLERNQAQISNTGKELGLVPIKIYLDHVREIFARNLGVTTPVVSDTCQRCGRDPENWDGGLLLKYPNGERVYRCLGCAFKDCPPGTVSVAFDVCVTGKNDTPNDIQKRDRTFAFLDHLKKEGIISA